MTLMQELIARAETVADETHAKRFVVLDADGVYGVYTSQFIAARGITQNEILYCSKNGK